MSDEVVFPEKAHPPADAALKEALGKAKPHWDALLAHLDDDHEGLAREWKFYGAKFGWQLKVAGKKKAILYLVPRAGRFLAALALDQKAVAALKASDLPAELVREVEIAKAYPEGRPARVEVTARKQLDVVKRLIALKLAAR